MSGRVRKLERERESGRVRKLKRERAVELGS